MHILFLEFYSSEPMPNYPELAKVHRARGRKVWLAQRTPEGDLRWDDGERFVHTQPGPSRLGYRSILPGALAMRIGFLRFILAIRRFVKEHHPNVVHVNQASLFYIFLLPLLAPKSILFIMDVRQPGEWGTSSLMGRVKNWRQRKRLWCNARFFFDHTCFMAEAAAERILGRRWRKWASVQRIAVDKNFLEVQRDLTGGHAGASKVRFLFIGTLGRPRRLEYLLYAAQALSERTKSFELHLVGPDVSEGYYPGLINELGIGDVVKILPPVPYSKVPGVISAYDVAIAYVRATADWLYQPTLKVLEYRAVGIPIIASDIPPNREIVTNGENGILVGESPAELASAMARFIEDRVFLSRSKEVSRNMRNGRTWADVAEKYDQEVYSIFLPK